MNKKSPDKLIRIVIRMKDDMAMELDKAEKADLIARKLKASGKCLKCAITPSNKNVFDWNNS